MQGPEDQSVRAFLDDLQSGRLSYEDAKQRYRQLGDAIRRRYEREITAVSVDVAQSRAAKGTGTELEAQLTFDAYHRWVEQQLADYGCRDDFIWAGDGLLAVFEQPEAAVWFGRALLEGLPRLNRINRLGQPIQIRIGIHTGPVLREELRSVGKIASATFDVAGHLQKAAAPNQMLLSDRTFTLLRDDAGLFVPIHRELPGPGLCFAYPPHSAALPEPLAYPGPPAPGRPGPRVDVSPLPWVFASAGLAVGVLAAAILLWPKAPPPTAGPARVDQPPVVVRQETPLTTPSGALARTAAPRAAGVPANQPPPAIRPLRSPAWGPARALWRSPDVGSSVPGRIVASPPELRWALCIGVGQYGERSFAAEGADVDARIAAQLLQRNAAVPATHLRLLVNQEASLNNLKQVFQWLQQSAGSGRDTVFVYLAGAAMLAPDRPDFRHQNGLAYALAPYDVKPGDLSNTLLYGTDLAAWLGATHAQTIVVLADTPYAGAMDVPGGVDPGRQFGLLAAAGSSGRTGSPRGPQAGLFVEALAAGLRGDADSNRDRRVSLNELQRYLRSEVARRSGGMLVPEAKAGFGGYLPEFDFAAGG